MNFEDIKNKMNAETMDDQIIPKSVDKLKNTQLPLHKIRRNLRNEIITQIVVFIILFIFPSFLKMNKIATGLYFVLLFITTLITVTYLLKMSVFLKRNVDITPNSKQVLVNTIHELNLTLEVYKTAIISGSLLLPFIAFIVYAGKGNFGDSLLFDVLTFNMNFNSLILFTIGYLVISVLIVLLTNWWTDCLYGKYIQVIEKTLEELKE